MFGLNSSELIFYIGVGGMIAAVLLFLIVLMIHKMTGKRLRRNLEREYGKKYTE